MNTTRHRFIEWTIASLSLVVLMLPLLPVAVSNARSDVPSIVSDGCGPVIASTASTMPNSPHGQPAFDPPHITFVIQYQGQAASSELMRDLTNLKTDGRITAIDTSSGSNRIFVLGQEAAVLALRELPGVVAISRADGQPISGPPPAVVPAGMEEIYL